MNIAAARRSRHLLTVATASVALIIGLTACGDSSDPDSSAEDAPTKTYDPASLDAAAEWLSGQLTDGVLHDDQYDFDDYGLTADAARALAAAGGHDDTVSTIADRLAGHIDDYTAPGFGTLVSAGGTAKLILVADAAGQDPSSYGEVDLVAQLEGTVVDDGPSQGRIADELEADNKDAADYSNVLGQALAVEALAGASSPEGPATTDFLLDQQCEEGWFRLNFTADPKAADQTCDSDPASAPDVDATAYAVLALASLQGEAEGATEDVDDAADAAVTWLESVQAEDGSFVNGGPGGVPNSDSTGLAGRVLGELGATDAAEQAAAWVSAHQVVAAGGCGAIAYDDAAHAAAEKRGITSKTAGQFRRATVDALPALAWAVDPPDPGC